MWPSQKTCTIFWHSNLQANIWSELICASKFVCKFLLYDYSMKGIICFLAFANVLFTAAIPTGDDETNDSLPYIYQTADSDQIYTCDKLLSASTTIGCDGVNAH